MIENRKVGERQLTCLDAMGISVWSLRGTPVMESVAADNDLSLKLGPGSGGILLVCASDTDSASKLANDVSRSLGGVAVWAWPDNGVDAVKPGAAIEEKLFTTIAVFGPELATRLCGDKLPQNLHSASLVMLPSMHDLENSAAARQTLWTDLCRSGMVPAS